jgi:hypothetical protein
MYTFVFGFFVFRFLQSAFFLRHETQFSSKFGAKLGQSEPAPMTAPVGRSVHRMGWMIRLFFIHLFTLR